MKRKATRAVAGQGAPTDVTQSGGGVVSDDNARGSIPHGPPDRTWTDSDLANVVDLRALRFTAPATLDDCIEAYKYAHAMTWSTRPRVDFMLNNERGVKMRVEIGNNFVEALFDAE